MLNVVKEKHKRGELHNISVVLNDFKQIGIYRYGYGYGYGYEYGEAYHDEIMPKTRWARLKKIFKKSV